jgi:predicted esterase
MEEVKTEEINVLMLHGCNQNEQMFRDLMKTFMEIGNASAKKKNIVLNWHFIQAKYPHSLGNFTWYHKELDVAQIGSIPMDHDLVDETLDNLDEIINKLNINVLFGFSQGANVASTFIDYRNNNSNVKKAVLCSGYSLVDPDRKPSEILVMNVISDSDVVVKPEFMSTYPNMKIMKHEKGHKLPTSKPFVREIIDFMLE